MTVLVPVDPAYFQWSLILDPKTLPPHYTEREVPGTVFRLSSNHWIDQELFDGWFNNHF